MRKCKHVRAVILSAIKRSKPKFSLSSRVATRRWIFPLKQKTQQGYVALEFVVAMGLLVLPTMMLVLQIPSMLEKRDRMDAIVSSVAQDCANDAQNVTDGANIAASSTSREMAYNSSFRQSTLRSARCVYDAGSVQPNSKVTAYIDIDVPSILLPGVPGLDGKSKWTYHAQHSVIIPAYRSFEE